MRELFHEISSTLRNNKLRTALTGFAVSWGIFLLIALLGAGNGLMNSFVGNIEDYISQNITVEGWRTSKPYAGYKEGRDIQLDESDVLFTESEQWKGIIHDVYRGTGVTSVSLSLNGLSVSAGVEPMMLSTVTRTIWGVTVSARPERAEQNMQMMKKVLLPFRNCQISLPRPFRG